jgi:hypothetical protein
MGVLTDFFIASDEEFKRVLRGWKRAAPLLDTPQVRTATNPFTGKPVTIRSRHDPASERADLDAVVDPDLSSLPRIDLTGTDPTNIAALAELLLSWDEQSAMDEVMGRSVSGPADTEQCVWELPSVLTLRLAELSESDIEQHGVLWSKKHQQQAMTIKNEWMRNYELSIPDSLWIERLQKLAELARLARDSNWRMYLWMCT